MIFLTRFNSFAPNPLLYAKATESNQNLQTDLSRRTWMCFGSLQSKLKKKNR